ncbi:MAG: hypothetical protein LBG46_06585, partial [Elusimicrobiota bacterium]|nr:hypothetical protein [Elusimicrobiota bacterium]
GSRIRKRTCTDGSIETWVWKDDVCPGDWEKSNVCGGSFEELAIEEGVEIIGGESGEFPWQEKE